MPCVFSINDPESMCDRGKWKRKSWILRARQKDQQIDIKRWLILYWSASGRNADPKADVKKWESRTE